LINVKNLSFLAYLVYINHKIFAGLIVAWAEEGKEDKVFFPLNVIRVVTGGWAN
jgi:hypothetical protein